MKHWLLGLCCILFTPISFAAKLDIIYDCLVASETKSLDYGDYYMLLDSEEQLFYLLSGHRNYKNDTELLVRAIPQDFITQLQKARYGDEYLVDLSVNNPPVDKYIALRMRNNKLEEIGRQNFIDDEAFSPNSFSTTTAIRLREPSENQSIFGAFRKQDSQEQIRARGLELFADVTKRIYGFFKRNNRFDEEMGNYQYVSDEQQKCTDYFAKKDNN